MKSYLYRAMQPFRWLLRSSMLRLTLLLSVVFAVGMGLAVFTSISLGRTALEDRLDATMQAVAATSEVDDIAGESFDMIIRELDDLDGLPRPFRQAAARGGGNVALGPNFFGSDSWRVVVTEDIEGQPMLMALSMEEGEDAMELLGGILWTMAALVLFLALLAGLAVGLFAQRRLRRINSTLGALAAGDLTARTQLPLRSDDLGDIARQLDQTAAALERLVSQTRNLSASIAHDLRTPLARLRSRLEQLPDGDERGAALEESERLSGIFDTIMRVARIEAAQGQDGFETTELGALAQEVEEIFGPVVEDEGKLLRLDLRNPATVMADRGMLIQALANLIQNALVHGGREIVLIAHQRAIGVVDNGRGVPPEQFEQIVKPMVRLDAARSSDGSGLGLALVRAVADRHGARLQLLQGQPQGLQVLLNFAEL